MRNSGFDLPIEQLLDGLANESSPLRAALLYRLSEPQPEDMAALKERWPLVPVERRRLLLSRMAEASETNFELDFTAVALFALDDEDEEVRRHAIEALWAAEDPSVPHRLVRMLQLDESAEVRAAAAEALGRFVLEGELGRLPPALIELVESALLESWFDETDTLEVRRRALESIAYSSREEVPDLIQEAAEHYDLKMQASALFAMGRHCDERWIPYITEALNHAEPELRFEAARAAGELELADAVPRLIEMLHEEDREIKEAAIWSLGEIGGPEAERALLALSERADLDEDLLEAIEDALNTAALVGGRMGPFLLMDDELEDGDE